MEENPSRVNSQEQLHTSTMKKQRLSFLHSNLSPDIKQRKEMQQRVLWALLDLCLKNHLFFSLRKRRCSLSVAQE